MKRFLCLCFSILFLSVFSCKIDGIEEKSDSKYGSLTTLKLELNQKSKNQNKRSLYIPEIIKATVTVSGYGMEDISAEVALLVKAKAIL